MKPVWRLVRGCLEDRRCCKDLENGQSTLELLKEERSDKAESEKGDRRHSLYPSLRDLEEMESEDSEGETQALMGQLERVASKRKKKHKNKEQRPSKVLDRHSALQAPPYQERTSSVCSPLLLSGCSFCPEVWGLVCTQISLAYPVLQDPQSKRV